MPQAAGKNSNFEVSKSSGRYLYLVHPPMLVSAMYISDAMYCNKHTKRFHMYRLHIFQNFDTKKEVQVRHLYVLTFFQINCFFAHLKIYGHNLEWSFALGSKTATRTENPSNQMLCLYKRPLHNSWENVEWISQQYKKHIIIKHLITNFFSHFYRLFWLLACSKVAIQIKTHVGYVVSCVSTLMSNECFRFFLAEVELFWPAAAAGDGVVTFEVVAEEATSVVG